MIKMLAEQRNEVAIHKLFYPHGAGITTTTVTGTLWPLPRNTSFPETHYLVFVDVSFKVPGFEGQEVWHCTIYSCV